MNMASPGGSDGAPQQAGFHFSISSSSSRDDDTMDLKLHNEAIDPTSLTMRLLEKITDNFSEERALGQGAYGKVYRGVNDNGQEIAVKLLYNSIQAIDDEQFIHEFDNLTMLRHPNIVRLVGYCYETQRQHKYYEGKIVFGETTYKALCFEYMHKGSLQNHLSDECGGLDWHTRYKIIKGTCEGLKYLHEGLKEPLYHLDLKPDNILLDENMVPKLADFGLSKIFSAEQTRVTQSAVGTFGYLPSEYINGNLVSKKLDIFSLGVVMTKIIAGPRGHTRRAEMSHQDQFLDEVNENWRKRLKVMTWNSPGSLEAYCRQVNTCTEIALSCMEIDRHKRPSIVDIVRELNKTEIFTGKVTCFKQNSHSSVASTSYVAQPDAPPPLPSTPSPHPPASLTLPQLSISRKLFDRKLPPGLLKITERVYVFDSCFTVDVFDDDEYRKCIGDIVLQFRNYYANASVKVFNFREGQGKSLLSNIMSSYEITVMDYPMQYQGSPLLTMEVIHHFLSLGESWLSMDQHNVLIMHCERGGLAVLVFMLAGLLLYQKQFTDEQRTLEMVYEKAPRWLIRLPSPINHMPSQIRYLKYISHRNISSDSSWLPGDQVLTLDYVVLRNVPDFNGEDGCSPIFRVFGQDLLQGSNNNPKELFSTPKKYIRLYKKADYYMIKIDIWCRIRGDVVLECISMDADPEREETMFRVVFNTSFIKADILMLNRDQIDTMRYAKDRFPMDFRAEVLFSEMGIANQLDRMEVAGIADKGGDPVEMADIADIGGGLPMEAFSKVVELFSDVEWQDPEDEASIWLLKQRGLDSGDEAAILLLKQLTYQKTQTLRQGLLSPSESEADSDG